ncbi:MAG: Transcriptional repressor NrdR [Microgenomates group bacterium GW2011_GWA2_44_7]|nr:MAG: Transcriptional repressor NrdR [Microgenomates group bacterium GW2011_GWA2_44_7]KKT78150.1 MAG: Transcriptional repressor NrdR [Microgenomates group bacterium GW2011_GWB1_44_8]
MRCPFCNEPETSVLESRVAEDGNSLRRRRECGKCRRRFTTYERVEGPVLLVIKRDGRREAFDREKIRQGILKACLKRPVSIDLMAEMTDDVEREILRRESPEVTSKFVGKAVLRRLRKVDKVAWMRFASIHMEFEQLEDFEKAIEKASE